MFPDPDEFKMGLEKLWRMDLSRTITLQESILLQMVVACFQISPVGKKDCKGVSACENCRGIFWLL